MKKYHRFIRSSLALAIAGLFASTPALAQTSFNPTMPQVPEIVFPATPDYQWKTGLVNSTNGTSITNGHFDNASSWNGNATPLYYPNDNLYKTNEGLSNKTIVLDSGASFANAGVRFENGNSIYVSSRYQTFANGYGTQTRLSTGSAMYLVDGGVVQLDNGYLQAGYTGQGTFSMNGGTLTVPNGVEVGSTADSTGYFYQVGGTAVINSDNSNAKDTDYFKVGTAGTGTAVFAGNAVTNINGSDNRLSLGSGAGSTGTAYIADSAQITVQNMAVGDSGTGNLAISGGNVNLSGWYLVGYHPSSVGSVVQSGGDITTSWMSMGFEWTDAVQQYDMSGGSINITTNNNGMSIATNGQADFQMTGGTVNLNTKPLYIGKSGGSVGTMTIDGGTIIGGDTVRVGDAGTGTLSLANTTFTASDIRAGMAAGAVGTINIHSGANVTANVFLIAGGSGGEGTINIYDGATVRSNNHLYAGHNATGTINQYGGDVSSQLVYIACDSGTGVYNISGGTLTTTDYINAGYRSGTNGTLNVSGEAVVNVVGFDKRISIAAETGTTGAFNVSDDAVITVQNIAIGDKGVGTAHISGGTITAFDSSINGGAGDGWFILGYHSGSTATVVQSGGDITTGRFYAGDLEANTTGTYSISGGTMTAKTFAHFGPTSSLNFVAGPNGFGKFNVGGELIMNESSVVNIGTADGVALIGGISDTVSQTIMTVGSGTPRLSPMEGEMYTATFAGNALTVIMNQGSKKGTISAVCDSIVFDDMSNYGWVELTDLPGGDPLEFSLLLSGETNRDAFMAELNTEFELLSGDDQYWKASAGAESNAVLIEGIAPTAFATNVFAWNFTSEAYAGAMISGMKANQVPEPATVVMLLLGLAGIGIIRNKRRRQ